MCNDRHRIMQCNVTVIIAKIASNSVPNSLPVLARQQFVALWVVFWQHNKLLCCENPTTQQFVVLWQVDNTSNCCVVTCAVSGNTTNCCVAGFCVGRVALMGHRILIAKYANRKMLKEQKHHLNAVYQIQQLLLYAIAATDADKEESDAAKIMKQATVSPTNV